jgi:hypothetical protein
VSEERSSAVTTTLRGGSAQAESRNVARALLAVALAGTTVAAALLLAAGAHRNAQIEGLRTRGVPVGIRISGCLGLLGGSGSNAASYSCRGTFALGGSRYEVTVPGDSLHRPGSVVQAIADRGDPQLVDLPSAIATERPSAGVYLVPSGLLALVAVALALLVRAALLRRRAGADAAAAASAAASLSCC